MLDSQVELYVISYKGLKQRIVVVVTLGLEVTQGTALSAKGRGFEGREVKAGLVVGHSDGKGYLVVCSAMGTQDESGCSVALPSHAEY